MELKVMEYQHTKYRDIKMFGMVLVMLVTPVAGSYIEIPHYILWGVFYFILTAAMLNILYRRGRINGRLNLGDNSVTTKIDGSENTIYLGDLEGINFNYTNSYKSLGRYFFAEPNFLAFKVPGGYEKGFQIVIEGKAQRQLLKEILRGYEERGIPVGIKSKVTATWKEF